MRPRFYHSLFRLLNLDWSLVIEPWSFPTPPIQGGRMSTARAHDILCPPCKIRIPNLLIPTAESGIAKTNIVSVGS